MNFTEITKWCDEHPDVRVEMYFTDIGIELEMQYNLGYTMTMRHVISYLELRSNKIDIVSITLDDMYNKLVPKFNMLEDVKWSGGRQSPLKDLLDALK